MDPDLDLYPPMLLSEHPLAFDLKVPGCIYEIKLDGYRMTALFGDGGCRLRFRDGADATPWFPEVAHSLATIRGGPYIVDGEVCVFDELGRSDLVRLQARAEHHGWHEGADRVWYGVFDLLMTHGQDVTGFPLAQRKALLAELLAPVPESVLLVGHFEEDIERVFDEVIIGLGLEGLVAKRLDSVYRPGTRSGDWVKIHRSGAGPPKPLRR